MDIALHGCFTTEEMGDACGVQQQAVLFIGGDPGAVAFHPSGEAQEAAHVFFGGVLFGQQIGNGGAGVGQSLTSGQTELTCRHIDSVKTEALLALFNQCEGQAPGWQGGPELAPFPEKTLHREFREPD